MQKRYESVVKQIQKLSAERQQLYLLASKRALTDGERYRLNDIKVELDNLWLRRKYERPHYHDPLDEYVEQWYQHTAS